MKINKVHILFEQSGTFKKEFNKLGYDATTYDISNDFNETDNVIDLFNEIENGYDNKESIFDNITDKDLIIAFFPCTWFSGQNDLIFRKQAYHFKYWSDEKVDNYVKERKKERKKVYELLLKFIEVVKRKKIRTIIENPYIGNWLLKQSEIKKPDLIISNRRELGDYYKKPTMFYYYNFEPSFMSEYTKINNVKQLKVNDQCGITRSLMHKDFANNFIRKYIIGEIKNDII